MAANKIDKVIEAVAPGLAIKREINRNNLSVIRNYTVNSTGGYRGGHAGRLRSNPSNSTSSEDKAAGWTYSNMVANALDLYRNFPLARSIVDVSATYLGESRPTATTSDRNWNEAATQYFNDYFWPLADARRREGVDFGEIQRQFDTWSWIAGDMLLVPFDGSLLPYEGLQIKTPSKLSRDRGIVNGVRVEKSPPFRSTHYYLCERTDKGEEEFTRLRATDCIYAGSRKWRLSMIRSVPDLHGIIDALHAYGSTNDNVQQRIKFESMVWTKERNGALGNIPGSKILKANDGASVEASPADWGMRFKINGDMDDFDFAEMKNPSNNYVGTMEHMARLISAGTGFPYEIVMHIYTSGSYTANRAARIDFAKALMGRWAWRTKVLNQRVWNWRIAKAIKAGELPPAPADGNGISEWWKCSWTLPHIPHIDEGKEVDADKKQWSVGQESLSDWAQQKGQTREQMLDAHDDDIRAMQGRAAALTLPLAQYMAGLFSEIKQEQQITIQQGE